MAKGMARRRWLRWVVGLLATPPLLFVLLAILVYLPPVQNLVVREVMKSLSQTLEMQVSIERVRLAFPLDLAVHETVVAEEEGDTLLQARSIRLNVELLPLLQGQVNLDGLEFYDVQLDTRSMIDDVRVMGRIGALQTMAHGIDLKEEKALLDRVSLQNADLYVALSDTAVVETASTALNWQIGLENATLNATKVYLSFPGDSMRVGLELDGMQLDDGKVDLRGGSVDIASWCLQKGKVVYTTRRYADDGRSGNAAFTQHRHLQWADVALPTSFSTDYLCLNDLSFCLKDFSYVGLLNMQLHIADVAFKEHSGLQLQHFSGKMKSSPLCLTVGDVHLQTLHSQITLMAEVPWTSIQDKLREQFRLMADVRLGAADMKHVAAAFVDSGWLHTLPDRDLKLHLAGKGTHSEIVFDSLGLEWDGMARLVADAQVMHPFERNRNGQARFSLSTFQTGELQKLLPSDLRGSVTVPSNCTLKGTASFDADRYQADVQSRLRNGLFALKAGWDVLRERYQLQVDVQNYPLAEVLPALDIAPLTARLQAKGRGLDFSHSSTIMDASMHVDSLKVGMWAFDSIDVAAQYAEKTGAVSFVTAGNLLQGAGVMEARLEDDWKINLQTGIAHADLQAMASMQDTVSVAADVIVDVSLGKSSESLFVDGNVHNIRFHTPEKSFPGEDLNFGLGASADTTYVSVAAGDLEVELSTQDALSGLTKQLEGFLQAIQQQLTNKAIDHYALKEVLPRLEFSVDVGTDNPLSNVLRYLGYTYDGCRLQLSTDPEIGLSGYFTMTSFTGAGLQLDDIDMTLTQDTSRLRLNTYVQNYKKRNPNKFDAHLDLHLLNDGAEMMLKFADPEGNTGIELGANAVIGDGQMEIKITPERPVIAYRQFEVNADNHLLFGKDKSIKANIVLADERGAGLRLYGESVDSLNDMTLSFYNINLKEVCDVLPYVPQFEGILNSDFHVMAAPGNFSAMAMMGADGLKYEGIPLGNVGLEVVYLPKESGEHYANAFVSANGEEVLALDGTYLSSGDGEFFGEALLTRFPLSFVNGFLVGSDLALAGRVGGNLSVNGQLTNLNLEGQIDFDSAHVYSDVYGFDFRLDEEPARISNSQLQFQNYKLHSRQSNNPLLLNGVVDMTDFSHMQLDLSMQATNFELINAKRQRQSLLYGKLYADYVGTIKGAVDDLSVRGKLAILGRTDMTYILKDSPLTVDDRLHELVRFVSFEDSVEVVQTAEAPMKMDITLGISISDAARFHCDLSEDGENYVDIEGGGDLTMRMTQQGDMRLTGRFVINSGEMKYSLPIIPLKTFTLHQGSYVDFTGDIANPTLNITATERMKATVTENDVPRTVAFDVGVSITQPLEKMGIEFIINAPDDLSMQNQLSTMTKAQRGKSAVALLATGMFVDDDALAMGGSGFKVNNALNAFLQSEIQNIAGSALKTIDVSIGMESGVNSMGASTTDYSFQFAKRFWGNRISVIVGGKVSTGENAENSAESFIDNVSVEYRLDKGASRYVRVFYDRGTHDPFEGQLMTAGAGIVLRRKTNKLSELFIFKSPKKEKTSPTEAENVEKKP